MTLVGVDSTRGQHGGKAAMIRLSEEEFEDLVAEAVESLPPAFDEYLEEVVIDVEPMPDAETVERLGLRDARTLLGLFHGVPLTEQFM